MFARFRKVAYWWWVKLRLSEKGQKKTILTVVILTLALSGALFYFISALENKGQNAAAASRPLQRPTTRSCKVLLFQTTFQSGSTVYDGRYAPPADCTHPWSMIEIDWNGTVIGSGTDRIGAIWISGAEIFRTSTPETDDSSWHVEKDVSEYSSLLKSSQNLTSIITAYSGHIRIVATLSFYETSQQYPVAYAPDVIIPVSNVQSPPWITISTGQTIANVSVSLPKNILNVTLEVYATGHHCDETWFDSYIVSSSGCASSDAFRETEIFLDGNISGVVWPVPVIYTGGINQNLWETIPAVNALNIPPIGVPLTPFSSRMADGRLHTIGFRVTGNMGWWLIDANMLVSRDLGSQTVSGNLTKYETPDVNRQSSTGIDWVLSRVTISETENRNLVISGYVNTSIGTIFTTVRETMSMSNTQVVTRSHFTNSLSARGSRTTTIITSGPGVTTNETDTESYSVGFSQPLISTKGILIIQIDQNIQHQHILFQNGISSTTMTSDRVLAHSNGETSESYSYADSSGECYDHYVATTHGSVTSDILNLRCA